MALVAGMMSAVPANAVTPIGHPGIHKASTSKTHKLFQNLAKQYETKNFKAGTYIVRLKDDPAATYTGNVKGFVATKPATGHQLNAHSSAVKSWVSHLTSKQNTVASHYGVKPVYHYAVAYNGFSAKLSAKQAASLSKSNDVSSLVLDRSLKVQADPTPIDLSHSSLGFLKVATSGGLWDKIGGTANAGKGIVLGDIDTGIAPENPSFAGDTLGTAVTAGTTPAIIDGGGVNTVQFKKADGNVFSSSIIPDNSAQGWTSDDLSTKIIAAHYFANGFEATGKAFGFNRGEYLSPRDGAGHGSHTASTAAGDYGVDATVAGKDYGGISGVAPAAKIAIYKVCWDGTATDESLDSCEESDIVAAVNQAVQDGVDVLNFSIGGGAAQTTFSPSDEAFLNATSAGIFVSAAAGNSGPDASTLDNAAPWETTVAASTIPAYEATVELGDGTSKFVGASISVPDNTTIKNADLVDATQAVNPSYTGTDANLCGPGSLDPAKVGGKVVLCDRGVYDRVAKSAEVKAEGGIGMVLVNVPGAADDTDSDVHSVPTVHVPSADHDKLHSYADAASGTPTVSFVVGNDTTKPTPVPQIAGFSSRGPVLAAGSDVLKPDVSAPGVGILAAVANGPAGSATAAPAWDFYSGTSMATPHISGLALDYLGVHPLASVSEIKSAMMTTATNLVSDTGAAVTDPFTQGAGEVNPTSYLNPGLLYLSTPTDWKDYLLGTGQVDKTYPGFASAKSIDPSNLNLASIAIGNLYGTQTVTRTVTAQQTGTYTASASIPGITVAVSPKSVKFTKVGQSAKFTVKFTRTSAALDTYATGFLTWSKSGSSLKVRSPLAVNPTSISVPDEVDTTGVAGSVKVPVTPGANLKVTNEPFIAESQVTNAQGPTGGQYTFHATNSGDVQQYAHPFTGAGSDLSAPGTEFARFNVQPVPADDNSDLDLYLLYFAPGALIPSNITAAQAYANAVAYSATNSNDETISYFPTEAQYENGGTFVTVVDNYLIPAGGINYAESFTNLTDASTSDQFTTNADVFAPDGSFEGKYFTTKTGVKTSYTATWKNLDSNATYDGFVFNYNFATGDSLNGTYFTFDTTKPIVKTAPSITGTAKVGSTLTGHDATFDSSAVTITRQWLSNGDPISGATGATYVPTATDLGHVIKLQESAQVGAGASVTTTSAATAVVTSSSTTAFTIATNPVTTAQQAALTVTVTVPDGVTAAAGALTVKDGTTTLKVTGATLVAGHAEFLLPKLKKGNHKITVTYAGNKTAFIVGSTSAATTLTVH